MPVHSKKTIQRRKIIGRIPRALAKVVYGLMTVHQVIGKNDGKLRGAPDGAKAHKSSEKIQHCAKDLVFQETRVFSYASKFYPY